MKSWILLVFISFTAVSGFGREGGIHTDSLLYKKMKDLEERIVRQERKINRLEVENDELRSELQQIRSKPTIRVGRKTYVNRVGSKQLVAE